MQFCIVQSLLDSIESRKIDLRFQCTDRTWNDVRCIEKMAGNLVTLNIAIARNQWYIYIQSSDWAKWRCTL